MGVVSQRSGNVRGAIEPDAMGTFNMQNIRVMVIDDSALIRALFCDVLDNAKGIEVCGVAANADEAREKISKLSPDVLTLDNEMPGMSGLEFLAEVMEKHPMPVIMLSSLTQAGTGTEKRAFELGAAHCFPKPISSSREEFNATVANLTEIVTRVAKGEVINDNPAADAPGQEASAYSSDGTIVTLVAGAAGLDVIKQVLASYPEDCPPTVLMIDTDRASAERVIGSMQGTVACEIEPAFDGMEIKRGRACLVHGDIGAVEVIPGARPRLRVLGPDRHPETRADRLLTSFAEAKVAALAGLLPGKGADGAKGLQALIAAGGKAFVQRPPDYAPRDRFDAVRTLRLELKVLKQDGVADWILDQTSCKSKSTERSEIEPETAATA